MMGGAKPKLVEPSCKLERRVASGE